MFWTISAILIFIALAFVLPALLRKRSNFEGGQREQNIFIANEQLKELEERFEKGEIESEDYQSTRDELEQSLFIDIEDTSENVTSNSSQSSLLSTAFITLLIPAIAIPVYLNVGNLTFTESLNSKKAAEKAIDARVPRNPDGSPDVDTMIAGLQQKMEENPDNAQGWSMLGRSYMVVKRYPEAVKAYERALKLKPDSANLMLAVADSLAMVNNGQIEGRPVKLIEDAIALEPENVTALWLGGMAARQQANLPLAIERWQKVLSLTQDPNERQEIGSLISEAMSRLSPEQKANFKKIEEEVKSTPSIFVTVDLTEEFKNKVNPTDLVFIYAKAMSGPPMPLAAVRRQVKDLPVEVELNDAMAMMPGLNLSSFSEVIVGARISKSGQPIAQDGDIYAEKPSVKAGESVTLNIDKTVSK